MIRVFLFIAQMDPAGWGGNHAGTPIPEYVTGDQCLFCHRNDIGPTWGKNAHNLTTREVKEGEFLIGRNQPRQLRKAGYGKFEIRTNDGWDKTRFGDRCAGCHTTAVDSGSRTFAAYGLDCYTCHGDVDLNHTSNTSLIWLSKKRRDDAKAVTSICAQCHLRGGKSRSTGLPYANNFIAGDNLFQDYQADLALAENQDLNAGDRHVYRNVRDVVINGGDVTCLSCHRVHAGSSERHKRVLTSPACRDCHNAEGPKKAVKSYTVRNSTCEY
jgi:predicted CXXCH cytochrome family protein